MTPDQRTKYVAVLRAIAAAVEADPSVPVPHGYLSLFPEGVGTVAAFLRAVPLPWEGQPPAPGDGFYRFEGDLGDYVSDGLRIYVNARPEDVATACDPVPVTVVRWVPVPEIAALLPGPELPPELAPDPATLNDALADAAEGNAMCPAWIPSDSGHVKFLCTKDLNHEGDHQADGARHRGEPPLTWPQSPPAPEPTCLSCGAAGNLVVRHVPARTGIAARDEWYCDDVAACAKRRAGHLVATSGEPVPS
jgi:hypothetical protein